MPQSLRPDKGVRFGFRLGLRLASGRVIGRLDLDPVGMQRPVAKRLRLAKFPLGDFGGLTGIQGVDFQQTLADFDLAAIFPEHVFHEPDDISRHEILLLHPSHSELTLGHLSDPGLREIKRLIAG